jgi:hypothetical protein
MTEGYKSKNIYNADETGLFFRHPPNETSNLKRVSCNGGKNSKAKIIVMLACNADGADKLHRYLLGRMTTFFALRM